MLFQKCTIFKFFYLLQDERYKIRRIKLGKSKFVRFFIRLLSLLGNNLSLKHFIFYRTKFFPFQIFSLLNQKRFFKNIRYLMKFFHLLQGEGA